MRHRRESFQRRRRNIQRACWSAAARQFSLEETRRVFDGSSVGRGGGFVARRRPPVHHLFRALCQRPLRQPATAGDAFSKGRGAYKIIARAVDASPALPALSPDQRGAATVRDLPGCTTKWNAHSHPINISRRKCEPGGAAIDNEWRG